MEQCSGRRGSFVLTCCDRASITDDSTDERVKPRLKRVCRPSVTTAAARLMNTNASGCAACSSLHTTPAYTSTATSQMKSECAISQNPFSNGFQSGCDLRGIFLQDRRWARLLNELGASSVQYQVVKYACVHFNRLSKTMLPRIPAVEIQFRSNLLSDR